MIDWHQHHAALGIMLSSWKATFCLVLLFSAMATARDFKCSDEDGPRCVPCYCCDFCEQCRDSECSDATLPYEIGTRPIPEWCEADQRE